jgi:hypothetical protein
MYPQINRLPPLPGRLKKIFHPTHENSPFER